MDQTQAAVPIVPCNDLDQSQAFYERLGFSLTSVFPLQGYRILHNEAGVSIHLTGTPEGWVVAERNAHGIYLYSKDVAAIAERFGKVAEPKPWGMREFAVSDPNGLLVRIGWSV